MRVLATIRRSSFAPVMQSQQDDLAQWVDEILTGVWYYQVRAETAALGNRALTRDSPGVTTCSKATVRF
jgi:hypothetical protein